MTAEEKYNKGVALLKSDKLNEALQTFNELIRDYPKNADYWSERGVIYYHLNKKKEALYNMDEAVKLQPNKSYRYSSRAYIRGHFKMIEQAIDDYKKAVELDPDDAIAYNNLGLLQEQIGYQDNAIKHFNIADELMKENDIPMVQKAEGSDEQTGHAQKEVNADIQKNSGIWQELKTLSSKEGRASFRRFLRSGFKKT